MDEVVDKVVDKTENTGPVTPQRKPRDGTALLRSLYAVWLLFLLCFVLALPFIVVATLAGLAVSGFSFITGGNVIITAEILTALAALAVETAGPRRLPVGLAPTPREQPGLWRLVRATAQETRTPVPDGLVLTGGTACELRTLRRPGPALRRHLILGSALPLSLTERQLQLVVAHALCHARRRRPSLPEALALHGVDLVAGLAQAAERRDLWTDAAARFARTYTAVCGPLTAREEHAADQAAADVYGSADLADALDALATVRADWSAYRRADLTAGLSAGCLPDDPLDGFAAHRAAAHGAPDQAAHTRSPEPSGDDLPGRAQALRAAPVPGERTAEGARLPASMLVHDLVRLKPHLRPYLVATDDDGNLRPGGFAVLEGLPVLSAESFRRHLADHRAAISRT